MVEREREKIESKGAYAFDLHEAIRDVRRAFANDNFDRIGSCLEALYDTCAPEIREAVRTEWEKINEKYQSAIEKIENAEFQVVEEGRDHPGSHWGENWRGDDTYFVCFKKIHVSGATEERLEQNARRDLLVKVWLEIYHERFRACVDCLDRHGELRKWRDVEYGKV